MSAEPGLLPAGLAAGVAGVARLLGECRHPWWIIGSTAVALHGADAGAIADIDVILSHEDFTRFAALGVIASDAHRTRDRFNSDLFGRALVAGCPVEFFAGLKVHSGGRWHQVSFRTAHIVDFDGAKASVPEKTDLLDLLELFGRDKDLERASALRSI